MALTKVTGDFIETGSITQGHLHSSHGITLDHIGNGSTNTFFTTANARAAISATGSLSYNNSTGVMSFTMPTLNTTNITEGDKLFFTNARAIGALTAGTNISIASNGTISSTDTNTTYSVGDGGLTQNNFTNALKSKLDGIAASATNVTNTNQLTNGAGFITSYTETDTLASVTGRGASTTTNITTTGEMIWGNGYKLSNGNNSNNAEVLSATTGAAGIVLKDSGGTFKMQLYGEGTAYGFLQSEWGGWDLKKINNGEMALYVSGTARTVIHSGNIASQTVATAGNADTVDGVHASNFIRKSGLGSASYYTADNWIEMSGGHIGTYWTGGTGSGWHLYPAGTASFFMRSGSTSEVQLNLNTAGTNRGFVYADSNESVGFLNAGGSWRLQIVAGDYADFAGSSVRAPLYYDRNNTNFFLHADGLSNLHSIDFDGALSGTSAGCAKIGRNHAYDTMELKGYGAEFMIGAQNSTININYRTCNNGASGHTPTDWFWRAGSSSSFSNHNFGSVTANGSSTFNAALHWVEWLRNHSNNNGIYWSNTGWHLYPQDSVNFYVRSGNTAAVSLNLYTANATRGYVYANSSNDVGFLNHGGTWRLRVVGGDAVDISGAYLQLSNSSSYIRGGTITTRQGSRFIDVGYNGSCYIQANRTDSSSSTLLMGGAGSMTGLWSRVGTTNGGASHNSSGRTFKITMGTSVEFEMSTSGVMSGDFNDTSDVLFKKNIENHNYGLDAVNNLKPREFNWKRNTRPQGKQVGFIAQEVEEIIPEVVHGFDGAKSINGTGLISILTKAIQELSKQVTDLKAEVESLKQ